MHVRLTDHKIEILILFNQIQAKINSKNCSYPLPVSSVKTVETSFGIPDPIQGARVSNNSNGSSDCAIEWPFIQEQFSNTISYTVQCLWFLTN